MCNKCHNELIDALLSIPGMDDFDTRMDLLANIPNSPNFKQHQNNARTHISQLVEALANLTLKAGKRALEIFIENAQARVAGHTLSEQLGQLYHQYEQCPLKNHMPGLESRTLVNEGKIPTPAYHLCTPHQFDLERLVQEFLQKVLESQGVVGFAIRCDYSKFLEIFRMRIENACRNDNTFKDIIDFRRPSTSIYDSIDKRIDEIKEIKFKNPHRYIFVPINLSHADKEFPERFWCRIYDEFYAN